ncbi:MAG: permease-like cell division protein FtsX [Candidatus Peribacteraceae bacterium]|nr:permease-like cell division protein FtsX [Candidatus Peribacteraceae bacterium]
MILDTDLPTVWKRGIKRGLQTLLREREWGMTLGVLISTLLLFQIVLIVFLGVEGVQSLLRERTDVRLEILKRATNQEIGHFFSSLQAQDIVKDAAYITREQAYERARKYDPELTSFLEEFNMGNPFPDTIGVTLKNLDDYEKFKAFIGETQWQGIVDPTFLSEVTNQEEQVYELLNFAKAIKSLSIILLSIIGIVLLFITTELVHRRVLSRSNEILVEKLVGASPLTMFIPFVTETCVLLILSVLSSIAVCTLLLLLLPLILPALQNGGALSSISTQISPLLKSTLPTYFLLEILLLPILAIFGTWLGMRKELASRTLNTHTT